MFGNYKAILKTYFCLSLSIVLFSRFFLLGTLSFLQFSFQRKIVYLFVYLLQDNYDNLGEECLDSVKTYTQMEAKNAVLNPVIATACHGYIDRYCADEVLHKVSK